jgi:hypothetical protein
MFYMFYLGVEFCHLNLTCFKFSLYHYKIIKELTGYLPRAPAFILVSCSDYFFDLENGSDMFLRNVC